MHIQTGNEETLTILGLDLKFYGSIFDVQPTCIVQRVTIFMSTEFDSEEPEKPIEDFNVVMKGQACKVNGTADKRTRSSWIASPTRSYKLLMTRGIMESMPPKERPPCWGKMFIRLLEELAEAEKREREREKMRSKRTSL